MLLRRKSSDADLLRLAVRVLHRLWLLQVKLLQGSADVESGVVYRFGLRSVGSFWHGPSVSFSDVLQLHSRRHLLMQFTTACV